MRTIDDLLAAKKISIEDYEVYVLFETNDMGKRYLNRMVYKTFMEEPDPHLTRGVVFAYNDGRRSILRRINDTIEKINQLKEANDDSESRLPASGYHFPD